MFRALFVSFVASVGAEDPTCQLPGCVGPRDTYLLQTQVNVRGEEQQAPPVDAVVDHVVGQVSDAVAGVSAAAKTIVQSSAEVLNAQASAALDRIQEAAAQLTAAATAGITVMRDRMASPDAETVQQSLEAFQGMVDQTVQGFLAPWSEVQRLLNTTRGQVSGAMAAGVTSAGGAMEQLGAHVSSELEKAAGFAAKVSSAVQQAGDVFANVSAQGQSLVSEHVEDFVGHLQEALDHVGRTVEHFQSAFSLTAQDFRSQLAGEPVGSFLALDGRTQRLRAKAFGVARELRRAATMFLQQLIDDFYRR